MEVIEQVIAEEVITYMLYFSKKEEKKSCMMIQGNWKKSLKKGIEGRTLGLIGFGKIGKEVAKRAVSLGMRILYYRPHGRNMSEGIYDATYSSLDIVLSSSDFVVICVPLNEGTKGMADINMIKKMKKSAYIIDVSEDGVMNRNDLKYALDKKIISGAAIDVYEKDSFIYSILGQYDNVILTSI